MIMYAQIVSSSIVRSCINQVPYTADDLLKILHMTLQIVPLCTSCFSAKES